MTVCGRVARALRLYALVHSRRPVKYTETVHCADATTMWRAALSDAAFMPHTVPDAQEPLRHRTTRKQRRSSTAVHDECGVLVFQVSLGAPLASS